jgi:hypothetical protein
LKEAGAGEAEGAAASVAAVPVPAGDGVAGGFDVFVLVGLACGAAGGAGVDVGTVGVDGMIGLGAGGAALGCENHEPKRSVARPAGVPSEVKYL